MSPLASVMLGDQQRMPPLASMVMANAGQAPSINAASAPSLADALSYDAKAAQDWLAQQQAKSAQMGLWNPQTGLPTQAGVTDAARQVSSALLMGTTAPGAKYYRSTNGEVNNPGVGWMMYADKADKVQHYGQNHYEMDTATIDPKEIVDAASPKFQNKVTAALKEAPDLLDQYQTTAKALAADAAPHSIVESAGLWDAPDLVQHVWDNVLEPNGWSVVRTPDGAISFDPAHARLSLDH